MGHFVGHNKSYDQVLVKGKPDLMGKMVTVEIYETGKHFMKGRLVDNCEVISPGSKNPFPMGIVSGGKAKPSSEHNDVQQLPNSIWTGILHFGLLILLTAITLDVCHLFN